MIFFCAQLTQVKATRWPICYNDGRLPASMENPAPQIRFFFYTKEAENEKI
jgi:hypothetical protein